jgi:hypothetical protein
LASPLYLILIPISHFLFSQTHRPSNVQHAPASSPLVRQTLLDRAIGFPYMYSTESWSSSRVIRRDMNKCRAVFYPKRIKRMNRKRNLLHSFHLRESTKVSPSAHSRLTGCLLLLRLSTPITTTQGRRFLNEPTSHLHLLFTETKKKRETLTKAPAVSPFHRMRRLWVLIGRPIC